MISKRLTLGLLATALGTAPALAQAPNAPSTPSSSPSASSSQPSATMPGGSGQFLTNLGREQIRGSRLIGVNIYGSNNERVGDVNDVILDRNGNATAVVIGVGGFLGIGEKDVAIPYRMVEWSFGDPAAATTTGTGAGTGAGMGTGAGTMSGNRAADNAPRDTGTAPGTSTSASTVAGTANTGTNTGMATTGTGAPRAEGGTGQEGHRGTAGPGNSSTTGNTTATGAATAPGSVVSGNTMAAASTADQGYPSRGTIRLSRADLQNAPSFTFSVDNPANRPQGDRPAGAPSPNAPAMAPGNVPPTQRP